MKARTKAAKRRGRPRKEGVARTDGGRVSRVKEQPSKLALEARARMHKINLEQARDQKAGSFLGRLHMAFIEWENNDKDKDKPQPEQSISTAQYHALLTAKEKHNDYLKAVGAPGAHYEPYLGGSGDDAAAERWSKAVKDEWTLIHEAIGRAQDYDRVNNLWASLDLCVFQEVSLPHMVGSIRTLGNVLARHFRSGPRKDSAISTGRLEDA